MTEEMENSDQQRMGIPSDVSALLEKWITTASEYSKAHRREARILQKRHVQIGAPSVGLSAVVGTSIFAAIQEATNTPVLKWTLALLSMAAAALAALLTFYNHGEKSANHKNAHEEYEDVGRQLDLLKTSITRMSPTDWKNILEGYSQRLEAIGKRAPIPESMIVNKLEDVLIGFINIRGTGIMYFFEHHLFPSHPSRVRLPNPHLPPIGFPEELERVFLKKKNRVEP